MEHYTTDWRKITSWKHEETRALKGPSLRAQQVQEKIDKNRSLVENQSSAHTFFFMQIRPHVILEATKIAYDVYSIT